MCLFGIDEVHLVQDWGDPSFREEFRLIALVHARMPRDTILMSTTATLLAGQETEQLLKTLNLKPGTFFFQKRSNRRSDVQDIYRTLRHGLNSWSFPDLDWIIEGTCKTIIYCENFSLCFRLRVYFYHLNPQKTVRIYNSLCFCSYNTVTRSLFVKDPAMQVIIATDALVVGMDFPNVADVVDLDCKHPNHGKQRKGRVGRQEGDVIDPRGITYVTKATLEKAKKMVEARPDHDGGKWVFQGLHIGMARLYVASCYSAMEDKLFENPKEEDEIPCQCAKCKKRTELRALHNEHCLCSGCNPEEHQSLPLRRSNPAPRIQRLTDKMIKLGTSRLEAFRQDLWHEKCDTIGFLPPMALLPDSHIKNLLDNFERIRSPGDLAGYVSKLHHLSDHYAQLFKIIDDLRQHFNTLRPNKQRPTSDIAER